MPFLTIIPKIFQFVKSTAEHLVKICVIAGFGWRDGEFQTSSKNLRNRSRVGDAAGYGGSRAAKIVYN